MSDSRAAAMFCPYCGEEDLRPNAESHGAWECRGCQRVFSVKFLGLLASGLQTSHPRTKVE